MSETNSSGVSEEFRKIIDDFTNDLCISFPELREQLYTKNSNDVENKASLDYDLFYSHCKATYPENFFDILYENNTLFEKEETKYLLPNINFDVIMRDDGLSEQSKKTIWKYLQLVLFCVCNNVENRKDFGDAEYLFQAIDENELHEKIQHTMNEMKDIFLSMTDNSLSDTEHMAGLNDLNEFAENIFTGLSGTMNNEEEGMNHEDASGHTPMDNPFFDTMDADKMKEHLSGIMGGKIGKLAKEIAEEATHELGINGDELTPEQQQDFMKNLFKNPGKLLNIVKNIGTKLEEKFKSGDLKESELFEEAQDIMGKMKDMPGLKQMMSSMGMNPGGKFDFKSMANKMQQNMRQAKAKERMQEKLRKNKEKAEATSNTSGNLHQVEENTFVWNDSNSDPNAPLQKSKKRSTSSSNNGKSTSKNRKKKGKGKK
jgi:hypothetical protein